METGIDSPETQPSDLSLRERKKRRTRARIADAAVVMFARKGFEAVSVADVAQAAEVSEQTVYNYFSTKEALVLDEAEAFAERFRAMVRERDGGMTVLDAVRAEALAFLSGLAQR